MDLWKYMVIFHLGCVRYWIVHSLLSWVIFFRNGIIEVLLLCRLRRVPNILPPWSWWFLWLLRLQRVSLSFFIIFMGFRVWHTVFTHFPHLIIFWLTDSPNCMMRAPMRIIIVHVLGLCISIFGGLKFVLILWNNLPIFLAFRIVFDTFVAWLCLIPLPFCFLGYVFTDLYILRLSFLSFSTTMVRATIYYCYGEIVFHFTDVSITSYLLRSAVINFSGVMYSLSSYGSLFLIYGGRILCRMPCDMPWMRWFIRLYVLSPLDLNPSTFIFKCSLKVCIYKFTVVI